MTKIEWTKGDDGTPGRSWNPVTGCDSVSESCQHCYARRMAHRLAGRYGYPEAPHEFDVTLHPERLEEPLHWRKPTRVLVCSMSDLFHADMPENFILDVFARAIALTEHTFIFLTKRAERMCNVVTRRMPGLAQWSNIWGLVTVENQARADERIPWLLRTPFAVRGVSYEPALGSVDFVPWLSEHWIDPEANDFSRVSAKLDWVITGGETGPGARPAHPDWFRSVRNQCAAAGVPFFFKQWGEWLHESQFTNDAQRERGLLSSRCEVGDGFQYVRIGRKAAGRLLDGRLREEWPNG